MLDWCRRCRKFKETSEFLGKNQTKYCAPCRIGVHKSGWFNRYVDSPTFKLLSFDDCIGQEPWFGFQDIAYEPQTIVDGILRVFAHTDLRYLCSFRRRAEAPSMMHNRLIYLASDSNSNLLKVGQSTNLLNRVSQYYNLSTHTPILFDVFETSSWASLDLMEAKIRNRLEYLGFILPKDKTDQRLSYIEATYNVR